MVRASVIYAQAWSQAWYQACGSLSPSPLSHTTHAYTQPSLPGCKAPQLSAESSGYSRPVGQTLWKPLFHIHSPPSVWTPEEVSGCPLSAGQAQCWRQLVILDACVCVFYLTLFEGIGTQHCCLLQVCRCDLQFRRFKRMRAVTKSDLNSCSKPWIVYAE